MGKLTTLKGDYRVTSNEKAKCRSLVSLCLGVLGKHLEDILEDLNEVSANFPPDTKMAMMTIARRGKLLNDDVLVSLADSYWDILDISGSEVTDSGLAKVAKMFKSLRAVDSLQQSLRNWCIRACKSLSFLVDIEMQAMNMVEIHCCRGCPRSDANARRCLGLLKPKLNDVVEESWEELDNTEIANGAESLRWLIWPKIDDDSRESLALECPRITVNPKPSPFSLRGAEVPNEALPDIKLDDIAVKDIDPKTWAVCWVVQRIVPQSASSPETELSIAERFRLAFVERDTRLAPKRAKNMRQHRRCVEKEWATTNADVKLVITCG